MWPFKKKYEAPTPTQDELDAKAAEDYRKYRESLMPFSLDAACPKCGQSSRSASVRHCSAPETVNQHLSMQNMFSRYCAQYTAYILVQDHLNVTCPLCSYFWKMRCANAEEERAHPAP